MNASGRFVAVFKGSRDSYQAAIALHERDMLEKLVTDFYAPLDLSLLPDALNRWARSTRLRRRFSPELPSRVVTSLWSEVLRSLVSTRWGVEAGDARIGACAGRLATERGCGIFAYNYYGHSAFAHYAGPGPKILFQAHPHPKLGREILEQAVTTLPFGTASIVNYELEFDERRVRLLSEEAVLADRVICASQMTKRSLTYAGISDDRIFVAPYGVDLEMFRPMGNRPAAGKFRVLFVGQLIGRKGLYYLLEAWKRLRLPDAELILAGRNPDREVLAPYEGLFTLHLDLPRAELVEHYQSADLFCFPSVLEGFGLVLLESLACGTPVLTTPNVGLYEELERADAGFVVPAGDIAALAERLEWCSRNREELQSMRASARTLAEQHTWQAFRAKVAAACVQAD